MSAPTCSLAIVETCRPERPWCVSMAQGGECWGHLHSLCDTRATYALEGVHLLQYACDQHLDTLMLQFPNAGIRPLGRAS